MTGKTNIDNIVYYKKAVATLETSRGSLKWRGSCNFSFKKSKTNLRRFVYSRGDFTWEGIGTLPPKIDLTFTV